MSKYPLPRIQLEDYAPHIGSRTVDRIMKKADRLRDLHVTNINATYYGGGVAMILTSLAQLMNRSGVRTGWRVIQGTPDYFQVTKKMHNAVQGADVEFSKAELALYERIVADNAVRMHLSGHDIVVVHDPQPLPLIKHYRKRGKWAWRCHVDASKPNSALWNYFSGYVNRYDAVIFSMPEYRQQVDPKQHLFLPAIDPFNAINKELPERVIDRKLAEYDIPTDAPLMVQVSRFDYWKDPKGVIEAFKIARKKTPCRLVLLGNAATDDPEGSEVYSTLLSERDDDIIISDAGDDAELVNALQRRADIVIQKSIREGFGLTVTEALWKGTPVIGGNAGGIRKQIQDGENGYLVSSVEECAERMVSLLKDRKLRERMSKKAKQGVKANFLLSRLMEQYFDLFLELAGRTD